MVALVARYQVTADLGTQEGAVCQSEKSPPSSPPTVAHLWLQLPVANRQRLLWLLTQLLVGQMKLTEEESHELQD
ncbi:hypothetical protein [Chroococcidiopsis sp. SAG 2025]|uniref:hypothetical protein n=1 Tax=Chroococcidiopsis sp. SAG 2025 TaxID=171389 RepID=UPI002936DEAA|nr:hypothetical protein [Chroococcidiopsis sp. SAG 2025]